MRRRRVSGRTVGLAAGTVCFYGSIEMATLDGGPQKIVPSSFDAAARNRYLHTLARQQALFDRIGVDPEIMYSTNPVLGVTRAKDKNPPPGSVRSRT